MTKSMQFSAKFGKFMFYFGNIIIGIIFVSPLIWMISASFKPEAEIFANMDSLTTFLPVQASLNNYAEVFSRLNLPQVFKNTLLYIALILIFDLLVNSMCGYALAKFEFRGKGAILNLVVALMVLPMEAIMLPLYIEMSQLGWVNTLAALVVPFIAKCFSIYMFRQFFYDIPDDLIEAAAIDCERESPFTTENDGKSSLGALFPSTKTALGFIFRPETALIIASIVASRMLSESICSGEAVAME